MSRCGDSYKNRVTGEYAVVLRGTEDRGAGPGIAHLTARPGAAVIGEHFHPCITGKFRQNRFELPIGVLFGLANDGEVDSKGRPMPLP
jgi:hypothetical protein